MYVKMGLKNHKPLNWPRASIDIMLIYDPRRKTRNVLNQTIMNWSVFKTDKQFWKKVAKLWMLNIMPEKMKTLPQEW